MMTLFKMSRFQGRYCLALLPVVLWLSVNSVQAAPNITCTASMDAGGINFGAITPVNAGNANITGTLSYSCYNSGDAVGYVSLCLAVGGSSSSAFESRYMTGPNSSKLVFNMALPSGEVWGDRLLNGKEYQSDLITIAGQSNFSDSIPIQAFLLSGYGNVEAKQGMYVKNFSDKDTALTVDVSTESHLPDCSAVNQGSTRFPFKVEATVVNDCKINTTSDIVLGSKPASTPSFIGSNNQAIDMTCTNGALYNIGLSPSNDNINGQGVMLGTDKTSQLPYQLLSNPTGTPWGNKGNTYGTLTNGVKGEGSGAAQLHTVYVMVPSADVKPDKYSDTVTIHVNY